MEAPSPVDDKTHDPRDSVLKGDNSFREATGGNVTFLGEDSPQEYRLYKQRFVGLFGLVLLNIVAGMIPPWFGPIANDVSTDLDFTLDEVNWFSNVVNLVYLPIAIAIPILSTRYGLRKSSCFGGLFLIISAWVRYAGTARSLSKSSSYGLIILGQILGGVAQPAFQVVGPIYSEKWFNLKGRTTATMLLAVANPVGSAIAQVISPLAGPPRTSILVMGIISTAAGPFALLISDAPPTPPTHAASRKSPSFNSLVRAMLGHESKDKPTYMTRRERLDFAIIVLIFGIMTGIVTSFGMLTSQDFEPYGYSSDLSGLFGAALLLAGLVAAGVTSPLFDRVLTRHLALTCKILCPILGGMWLSLIWAVKPNNTGGIFAIMVIIGACSLTVLPVALELSVEVTRNADASSALLWFAGNLMSITCILVEGALRAGPDGNPPYNMHRALIYQGSLLCCAVATVFALQGKQTRRELDEIMLEETKAKRNAPEGGSVAVEEVREGSEGA